MGEVTRHNIVLIVMDPASQYLGYLWSVYQNQNIFHANDFRNLLRYTLVNLIANMHEYLNHQRTSSFNRYIALM